MNLELLIVDKLLMNDEKLLLVVFFFLFLLWMGVACGGGVIVILRIKMYQCLYVIKTVIMWGLICKNSKERLVAKIKR